MPSAARPIVFLSDFGLGNEWVRALPLGHEWNLPEQPHRRPVPPDPSLEIVSGALLLADSIPYIPANAVVLAVVDPSVGKDREVAIRTTSGRDLVGPDNGLLSLAWDAAGGVETVVEITSPNVIRRPITESFRAPDLSVPRPPGSPRGWRSRARYSVGPEFARRGRRGRTGDRARQDQLRGDRLQPIPATSS